MNIKEDVFAAVAMHGLLSRSGPGEFDFDTHPADALRAACWAFEMGRTMVRVRSASSEEITKMFEEASKTTSIQEFMSALQNRDERLQSAKAKFTN